MTARPGVTQLDQHGVSGGVRRGGGGSAPTGHLSRASGEDAPRWTADDRTARVAENSPVTSIVRHRLCRTGAITTVVASGETRLTAGDRRRDKTGLLGRPGGGTS